MPKVSSKNQITLPQNIRAEAGIKSGDIVEIFVFEGKVTLVNKKKGAGKGILKGIKVNKKFTDEESLQSAVG